MRKRVIGLFALSTVVLGLTGCGRVAEGEEVEKKTTTETYVVINNFNTPTTERAIETTVMPTVAVAPTTATTVKETQQQPQNVTEGVNPKAEQPMVPTVAETTTTARTTMPRTTTEVKSTKMAMPEQTKSTTNLESGEQTVTDVLLNAVLDVFLPDPPAPWFLTEEVEEELPAPPAPQEQEEEELPNPPAPQNETEEELPNPPAPQDEAEEELPNPPAPQDVVEEELPNPTLQQEEEEEVLPNPPAPQEETETPTSTEVTQPSTVETETETLPYVVEPPDRNPEPRQNKVSELPDVVMEAVWNQQEKYPNMHIGVGIYSLDGAVGYTYNANDRMAAGCTVKAAYAMYVLEECERQGIDIEDYYLTYKEKHKNNGSGVIRDNFEFGQDLSISYLVKVLLRESDNTAYNILLDKFTLSGYQKRLNEIGGQKLDGVKYGRVSVEQRKNEWVEIYKFINSRAKYADKLRSYLSGSKYCYICKGMTYNHSYLHKSGWIEGSTYTCAADCAIVDDAYLVIVLTYDPVDDVSNAGAVKAIGRAVEKFVASDNAIFS